jgi:hypothetical protein
MTASTDPHRPHIARALFALLVLGWAAIASAGAASADDDDDDDDDDDSSSSVITTWPPTAIDWPPQLAVADDSGSDLQGPIVLPTGQPLLPSSLADPALPIVPVTITPTPEVADGPE